MWYHTLDSAKGATAHSPSAVFELAQNLLLCEMAHASLPWFVPCAPEDLPMRVKASLLSIVAAATLFSSSASAQLVTGAGWQVFEFSGLGQVQAPFGSFAFNPLSAVQIKLTDCCIIGDRFKISWTGTAIGSFTTSDATAFDGTLGSTDPNVAFADVRNSTGSFNLGAGNYTMTLETVRLTTGYSTGTGWIRADVTTVPEPGTIGLVAAGLIGLAGAARRRKA